MLHSELRTFQYVCCITLIKTFQEGFGQDGEGYGGQTSQNYLVQHETGVLQSVGIKGKSFIAIFREPVKNVLAEFVR